MVTAGSVKIELAGGSWPELPGALDVNQGERT